MRGLVIGVFLFLRYSASAFRATKHPITKAQSKDSLLINDYQDVKAISHHGRQASSSLYSSSVKFKDFDHVLDCFHGEPILIYFSTTKCGPCQLMKKELKVAQAHIGDKLKMFSVDTEKWPSIASRLHVATLPCLVVFQEGETIMRMEGLTPAESIVEQLSDIL